MKFSYNNRIIEQLGTELITSNEVAITEIIKNSYDAGASRVNIHFLTALSNITSDEMLNPVPKDVIEKVKAFSLNKKVIVIEDNGKGMNATDLEKGFFTIGSDYKKKQKETSKQSTDQGAKRIILGDKGLGRLATQRLSPILFVETTIAGTGKVNLFQIEWSKFIANNKRDVPEFSYAKNGEFSYTRLWMVGSWPDGRSVEIDSYFEDLRPKQQSLFNDKGKKDEADTGIKLKENLQSEISFLYSPFEKDISDFVVSLWLNGTKIRSEFQNDSINIAESTHSFELKEVEGKYLLLMKMDIKPWYIERVHFNLLGKDLYSDWRKDPAYYTKLLEKYKNRYAVSLSSTMTLTQVNEKIKTDNNSEPAKYLLQLAPIEGKVFSFKRDNQLLSFAIKSAIENKFVPKNTNINKIRPFLDYHNGVKLYRDKFRIANIGNKNNDWLKLQQARTRGQQFYRFELGNVIGYIKISDFFQDHIQETSSRQEIRDNEYKESLLLLLEDIFNDVFYKFTKSAYEISRDILNEEKLIPKNTTNEIKEELDKSNTIIKEAQEALETLKKSFSVLDENIGLDDPAKIKNVQAVINRLRDTSIKFDSSIDKTVGAVKNSQSLLKIVEQQKKNIELETYNNYKLMANGLITEVLTHELHSILNDTKKTDDYKNHIKALEDYLIEASKIDLFKEHLNPLDKKLQHLYSKMDDLNRFYLFLENTFLYKGTIEDFVNENLKEFLVTFEEKVQARLKKNKIDFDYSSVDNVWNLPKGALIHVFYNLVDNSIYWISERQRRAIYDKIFETGGNDSITVKKINEKEIHVYDTGLGVSPEYQHTLFHALVSGKEKGRGMGMYIVKKFLESFDATIELLPDINRFGNRYIFSIIYNYDSGSDIETQS